MRRVVVLGYDLKRKLFTISGARSGYLHQWHAVFVIGVLRKKISLSSYFSDDDSCGIIPIKVMGMMRDTVWCFSL